MDREKENLKEPDTFIGCRSLINAVTSPVVINIMPTTELLVLLFKVFNIQITKTMFVNKYLRYMKSLVKQRTKHEFRDETKKLLEYV